MIKTLDKSGRTEDDAINAALAELGLDRDDVSVEILERAKSGFFGIGASPAVVRVSYEVADEPAPVKKAESKPAPAVKKEEKKNAVQEKKEQPEAAKPARKEVSAKKAEANADASAAVAGEDKDFAAIRTFLSGLFERMNVSAEMEISRNENGIINVDLTGDGLGGIIGRRGETLDAVQHLTNYVVNRGRDKRTHINIDAESYRSKREDSLIKLAEKMAEKAIKYKRNMSLEPMNSYERHVIHTALQEYKGVTTSSTGEEPNRRVVIIYDKESDMTASAQASKPKSREWA